MEPQQVYQVDEEMISPPAIASSYYSDQLSRGGTSMDLGRELTRQLTQALNLPRDAEALRAEETRRGEEHSPLVHFFGNRLLRNGLLAQVAALFCMGISYVAFGGRGFFVFDSLVGPETVRVSDSYHLLVALLMLLYLAGTVQIACFQIFIADSSKWSVGFRSGSKFLSAASSLDLLATTLRLVQSLHAYFYISIQWWAKYQRTQSDWGLFHIAATLHAFSLLTYGLAFFFLECYHDQGTYEEYGVALLALYGSAGAAELLMVYTNYGAFFSLLLFAALLIGVSWAFQFEPLLERCSPALHSRNVADNILPHAAMLRSKAAQEGVHVTEDETLGEGVAADSYSGGSPVVLTASSPTYTAMPVPLEGGEENGSPATAQQLRSASVIGVYQRQSDSPETAPPTTSIPLSVMQLPGRDRVPTTYDYSQMQQQLQTEGVEPGVVRGDPHP